MSESGALFSRLVEIIKALRTPGTGCPWDLEQTHQSLRPYLIEECYEVLDAIDEADDEEFAAELGDVLLQVVLHAQVASDRGAFEIGKVLQKISEKMIHRHPHVFGDTKVTDTAEVLRNWEQRKLDEKRENSTKKGLLDGVPKAMPALLRARRIGEKASKVNFDWPDVTGVWAKVHEELNELQAEYNKLQADPTLPKESFAEELGDLLFTLSQLARRFDINPEDALHSTNIKFIKRFQQMEQLVGRPLSELTEKELDEAWEKAKSLSSST